MRSAASCEMIRIVARSDADWRGSRWRVLLELVVPLALLCAGVLGDALLPPTIVITSAFAIAPFAASALTTPARTGVIAALSVVAVGVAGTWNQDVATSQWWVRVVVMAAFGGIAVLLADLRVRRERALTEALQREQASLTKLQEADRVKDEVISTISHELRTPLSSIRGYSELLAEGDLGELSSAQADALTKVLRNIDRLASLVEKLLQLDQAGSGRLTTSLVPTDLADITHHAWDALEQVAKERDLTLRLHTPHQAVPVTGDPDALERVVENLGSNAIKFTPDGGTIDITVDVEGHEAVLRVSDTGIGIAETDQEHLGQRFFRTSEANESAVPGSGLGLAIVRAILTAHQATLDIDSTPGRGTTMTVRMPSTEGPDAGEVPRPTPSARPR